MTAPRAWEQGRHPRPVLFLETLAATPNAHHFQDSKPRPSPSSTVSLALNFTPPLPSPALPSQVCQFGRFLDSTLRRCVVRGEVCVRGVRVTGSVMLAGGHRGRPVVVQVPRGVVGKVIEAVEGGAGRGRQRIRVATPAHVHRTALHGGRPVGAPVGLEDVGLILRRRGRGILLWGAATLERGLVVGWQRVGILVAFAKGWWRRAVIAGGHGV